MQIGDKIPGFTLKNQEGEEINIDDHVGKHPIILFFYPKDFTRGCTKEACAFRDNFDKIKEKNAVIFGISSDSIGSHKKFKVQYDLPFDLLSDKKGLIRKKLGVRNEFMGLVPGRTTFLFDREGILKMKHDSLFGALDHVNHTLDSLDTL